MSKMNGENLAEVWYRHSGQSPITSLPSYPEYKAVKNEQEIVRDIGNHHITHMTMKNRVLTAGLTEHLQALRLEDVSPSHLDSLSSLSNLKELDLSRNDFSSGIPPVVSTLTTLTQLKLFRCRLTQLPESLYSLSQLQSLNLNHNDFSAGLPPVIPSLSTLTSLDLNNCKLTELPDNLSSLGQLQNLSLENNDFSAGLPPVIPSLSTLNYLHLDSCKLTELPDNLSSLSQLRTLGLDNNNFSAGLPPVIPSLSTLTELKLNSCKLTELPDNLSSLSQLESLWLNRNDFSAGLPPVIPSLSTLTSLYLGNCKLTELPDNFGGLKQLTRLYIEENSLKSLPASIYTIQPLSLLALNRNKSFSAIDQKIINLKNLTDLSCGGCKALVSPPYDVCQKGIEAVREYFVKSKQKKINESSEQKKHSTPMPPQDDDNADSDLSDSLEYIEKDDALSLKLCEKPHIQDLFYSNSVYRMTKVRGHCLIINNLEFSDGDVRHGSDIDGSNLLSVFNMLSFECTSRLNLSAQQMMETIESETSNPRHQDFGMFVLIILSHGTETHIFASDGRDVKRTDIYAALSAQRFPSMARKPKLLIIQACSGDQRDNIETDARPSTSSITHFDDVLSTDDLFIMHASFVGHVAMRNTVHGSWFVRALVEAFYKHACHRDVVTLFQDQVMKKVRFYSIVNHRRNKAVAGQHPIIWSTPTKGRKLYLFPGYNPPDCN